MASGDSEKWRVGREERRDDLLQFGNRGAKSFLQIKRDTKRLARRIAAMRGRRGRPLKGENLKDDAISLLRRCQSAGVPPPDALIELFTSIVGAKQRPDAGKPDLTENQWAGLRSEIKHDFILDIYDEKGVWTGKWPTGSATLGQVANRSGTTRGAVQKWRKDPEYFRGLIRLWWEAELNLLGDADLTKTPTMRTEAERIAALKKHVEDKWAGPTRSILDNKMYATSGEYLEHLISREDVWPAIDRRQ